MEDRKEKRRDPRVALVLRVEYPGAPQALRDATENLSAGGLFIRTDRELPEGTPLTLRVGFPGLLEPLVLEAEVVRRRPAGPAGPAGLAVRLAAGRADDRRALARLSETARASGGAPGRAYRVLVVEDNPHVVEMYEYALRKLRAPTAGVDLAIEYAPNGHEALRRLGEAPRVDLVLADLYMPVLDGFGLVGRMKADAALAATPVMIISAAGAEARERALALGVDVYLQKPVQFGEVLGTVRTLLRLRA